LRFEKSLVFQGTDPKWISSQFHFNNRGTREKPLNDGDRFMLAVSQISGKRLTYAELTGKVQETTA
jgi:hypothetical protein